MLIFILSVSSSFQGMRRFHLAKFLLSNANFGWLA